MLGGMRPTRRHAIKFLLAGAGLPLVAGLTLPGAAVAMANPDGGTDSFRTGSDRFVIHQGWVLRSDDLPRLAKR